MHSSVALKLQCCIKCIFFQWFILWRLLYFSHGDVKELTACTASIRNFSLLKQMTPAINCLCKYYTKTVCGKLSLALMNSIDYNYLFNRYRLHKQTNKLANILTNWQTARHHVSQIFREKASFLNIFPFLFFFF